MNRTTTIAAVAAVVCAAAVIAYVVMRDAAPAGDGGAPAAVQAAPPAPPAAAPTTAPPAAPAPHDDGADVAAAAARTSAPAVAAAPSPASQPPDGTPLRELFAELDARARRGDAAAACRLGAELSRCRQYSPGVDRATVAAAYAARLAQQRMPAEQLQRHIDANASFQEQMEQVAEVCAGVDLQQLPTAARYFEMAARAGHVPSMAQFVDATHLRTEDLFRDPELIPLYESAALRYFMAALEAGEPTVYAAWFSAAGNPGHPLHRLLPAEMRDPRVVAALGDRMHLQRTGQPRRRDTPSPWGEPDAAARERAEAYFQRYFADAPGAQPGAPEPGSTSRMRLDDYRCGD